MPTKKKKKAKKTSPKFSIPSPIAEVDPTLWENRPAPAVEVTAPYAYKPVTESKVNLRKPINISGSDTRTSYSTVSDDFTVAIGPVTVRSILLNYNLAATLSAGSVATFQRFRLDIVRGSTTIFTVSATLGAVPANEALASNSEIVLEPGDEVNIVSRLRNTTNLTYYVFGSLMIQPYE